MELTTDNLIKIIIAVGVMVLVIFGTYISVKNYIIPYFGGIDFNDNYSYNQNPKFCEGKVGIGYLQEARTNWKTGKELFLFLEGHKTDIYFNEDEGIYINNYLADDLIGRFIGGKVEIYFDYVNNPNAKRINGAFIGGKELCL